MVEETQSPLSISACLLAVTQSQECVLTTCKCNVTSKAVVDYAQITECGLSLLLRTAHGIKELKC